MGRPGPNPEYVIAEFIDPITKKSWLCWWWQGSLGRKGYGVCYPPTHLGEWRIHRYYYKKYNGLIKKGYEIHHKCSNKVCVNPAHLKQVKHTVHSAISNSERRSFTDLEVRIICSLHALGMSKREIGRMFDCPKGNLIRFVVSGKHYQIARKQLAD